MSEDRLDSLRKSKWPIFDRAFAAMIKEKHPDIWDEGGNIKGDDQYEILTKIAQQGGVAKTEDQIKAIELREAWIARHLKDYRLPGVVAQIKWLAVGSRGEDHMKELIREEIKKREISQSGLGQTQEVDDFLEHYGVKGMKWGVRRDRDSSSSRSHSSSKDQKPVDPKLAKELTDFISRQKTASMNGPEPNIKDEPFYKRLTPEQKRAAAIFGTAVVVAGLAYGTYRYSGLKDPSSLIVDDPFSDLEGSLGAFQVRGMLAYKNAGVDLPKGTIVTRVSKEIETKTRSGGFYAAHESIDKESYISYLGKVGGHINNFEAQKPISAPSTTEYVSMLGRAMNDPRVLIARGVNPVKLSRLSATDKEKVLNRLAALEIAEHKFPFSLNSGTVDGLLPRRFIKEVLGNGYTSVIDYNNTTDFIAKAPMRHLDGTMFKFASSSPITKEVKDRASANETAIWDELEKFYSFVAQSAFITLEKYLTGDHVITKPVLGFLAHISVKNSNAKTKTKGRTVTPEDIGSYLEHQGLSDDEIDDFLEHFGVKGMKWGVRRQNRVANLKLVGQGKGNALNKARALGSVSALDLAKGRGLKGAAKRRGERLEARNERVMSGKASALDKIKYYGGTRTQDLLPTKRNPNNAKSAFGASVAAGLLVMVGLNAVALGAIAVANR